MMDNGLIPMTGLNVSTPVGRFMGKNALMVKLDLGTVFTPFSSLMSHSCDPNVLKTFSNGKVICFTSQYIDKGQQVF